MENDPKADNQEFDYLAFARAYMGPWTDLKIKDVLTKINEPGFEYEDNVSLYYKPLLNKIAHCFRVPSTGSCTIVINFEEVESKLNSDCLAAVEHYARVLLCERGYAASWEDSGGLLGLCGTEFPGLILWNHTQPVSSTPKTPLYEYKPVYLSLDSEHDHCHEMMEELDRGFQALEKLLGRDVDPDFRDVYIAAISGMEQKPSKNQPSQ